MKLTLEERETHCWRDDRPDGGWQIETLSPEAWRKLDAMFTATEVLTDHGRTYGKVYRIPPNSVSFHKPRVLSEAQRLALAKTRAKATAVRVARAAAARYAGPS